MRNFYMKINNLHLKKSYRIPFFQILALNTPLPSDNNKSTFLQGIKLWCKCTVLRKPETFYLSHIPALWSWASYRDIFKFKALLQYHFVNSNYLLIIIYVHIYAPLHFFNMYVCIFKYSTNSRSEFSFF